MEVRIGADEERANPHAGNGSEGQIEVAGVAGIEHVDLQAERTRRLL